MSAIDEAEDRLFTSIMKHRDQIERFKQYKASGARSCVWTCKDGSKIKLKHMSLDHLKNALRLLEAKDPTHEAILYLKWEISFREDYPKIVEVLNKEEATVDLVYEYLPPVPKVNHGTPRKDRKSRKGLVKDRYFGDYHPRYQMQYHRDIEEAAWGHFDSDGNEW